VRYFFHLPILPDLLFSPGFASLIPSYFSYVCARRVLEQLVLLPIKMERVWLFYVNMKMRLAECMTKKKGALVSISILERRFPESLLVSPPAGVNALPTLRLVKETVTPAAAVVPTTLQMERNKLMGEIEILRELIQEAELNAKPYDSLALQRNWALPVAQALDAAGADAPMGSLDSSDSSDSDESSSSESDESDELETESDED